MMVIVIKCCVNDYVVQKKKKCKPVTFIANFLYILNGSSIMVNGIISVKKMLLYFQKYSKPYTSTYTM